MLPSRLSSLLTALATCTAMALAFGACDNSGQVKPTDLNGQDEHDHDDTPAPPDLTPDQDMETETLDPNQDSDGDCIPDGIELSTGTNPYDADSDGDTLPDGLEDANCNGRHDPGETDPRRADTDADGLCDGGVDVAPHCVAGEDRNANGQVDPGETDPLNPDTDADGLRDGIEAASCTDPLNPDSDDDGILDGIEDKNGDGVFQLASGETNPCDPDTDGDGLHDGCEDANRDGIFSEGETNPRSADTDRDGLDDGVECSGRVNHCADFDHPLSCPSDPRSADTDGDGLNDAIEKFSDYRNGATDPRNPDTDGDTLPDGLEDFNKNGRWDEALGELDPTTPETYPGKPDAENPIKDACKTDTLRPTQAIIDQRGDWLFLVEPHYLVSPLTLQGVSSPYIAATAIDDATQPLAAFVISKPPESGAIDAATELDYLDDRLGLAPFFPRSFRAWDDFQGRTATYHLSGATSTRAMRDQMLATMLGLEAATIAGLPGPGAGAASTYEMRVTVLYRSAQRVIVVATFTPADQDIDEDIALAIRNLTNGTALAQDQDEHTPSCEMFTIAQLPMADFIFIIDDSSSMKEEQDAVFAAASSLFAAVTQTFIEARWSVASVEHDGNSGVSAANVCGMLNHPKGPDGSVWASFEQVNDFLCKVKDPAGIQNCDPPPDDFFGHAEYGLKCAEVAIDYVQGRYTAAGVAPMRDRQRAQAALIVIIMTDEEDYQVESGAWTVEQGTQYYTNYFNVITNADPNRGRTVPFAFLKLDGSMRLFERLFMDTPPRIDNAVGGDIDDTDDIPKVIAAVIQAAGGLASTFNPRHAPITVTMKVVVRDHLDGTIREIEPSALDGWRYDPFTNAMVFYGNDRPALHDDFALSYRFFIKKCQNPNGCSIN